VTVGGGPVDEAERLTMLARLDALAAQPSSR
jgi:hypothetical protein